MPDGPVASSRKAGDSKGQAASAVRKVAAAPKRRGAVRNQNHPNVGKGVETRAGILEAALEVFAELDYESASVREITRRLGVSHNIVHYHFGSKKRLWEAALEHGMAGTMHELVDLYAHAGSDRAADPGTVLRTMVKGAVRSFVRFPALAAILTREGSRPGKRLDFIFDRFTGPVSGALQEFLRNRRDQGVRDFDPRFVVLYIVGGAPGLYTHKAFAAKMGIDLAAPGVAAAYEETVAHLLVDGLVERA